jgi:hypothetical protein
MRFLRRSVLPAGRNDRYCCAIQLLIQGGLQIRTGQDLFEFG